MPEKEAPEELINWMTERIELITKQTKKAKNINNNYKNDKEWTLKLLEQLSDIETTARRAVHLLNAHALRDKIASATEISKASNITIATAMNRGGSKLAQEVWNEVHLTPR